MTIDCTVCERPFDLSPCHYRRGQRACSRECGAILARRRAAARRRERTEKRCPRCGETKPLADFKRGRTVQSYCPSCRRERDQERLQEPSYRARRAHLNNLRRHGITEAEYEALLEAQGGRCAVCRAEPGTLAYTRLTIDHDHDTGRVRGLLCLGCNAGMGQMGDDPTRLRDAARYLESHG